QAATTCGNHCETGKRSDDPGSLCATRLALLEARLVELQGLGVLCDRAHLVFSEASGLGGLDLNLHDQLGAILPEVGNDLVGDMLEVDCDLVGSQCLATKESSLQLALVDASVARVCMDAFLCLSAGRRPRQTAARGHFCFALLGSDIGADEQKRV